MTDRSFQLGDLVTRDGTDVHRVTEPDDGYGCITVVCIKAPIAGWCKVDEEERNLSSRYEFSGDIIEAKATVISGLLPLSK